ncbi:unnamed protein product [Phaedon cochleariae]|uniref:ACB domain-containing protein n=1 Tax=Phaedon cochleariae TaxID=80249 RepID=A0A9P0DQ08_PHACE|nr:unnamed protein product [Phaedon cochleariae]
MHTMSLEQNFKKACDEARKFTKRPPEKDILEIYSLFKQATVGDINKAKPSDVEGKTKWEAWNSKKGMSPKTAKEQYIKRVESLSGTYK